ncbi:MAG: tripartite tricarboxylate transporter substrate binding protein [Betaproteobacteria bacterium]|nr:tripartite tricarboxylate transporter substrate binding protein [Betaproteobacteria bacterium]
MKSVVAMCLAALLAAAGNGYAAQGSAASDLAAGYPARPVRLIVPFPPGGSNDFMARSFAHYLTERLGRQVVVDNRAGADAIIGTEIAARSQPDGYTLLVASAAYAVNGATRKVSYDPLKSFAWIGTLGFGPSVLTVGPALKVNSAKELIAHGRANPGKLTMASSGGYAHFASELFNHLSGMKMLVVLYKGGFPALVDVMGGQAHVNLGSLIQTLPHLKSGRLKALATSGSKRAAAAPDLPTIAESGVAGYEANNWWAIAAPAGTPAGVIAKLSAEMTRYLKLPETLKRFEAEGVEAEIRTPAEVHKMVPGEIAKWKNVAKVANIRTE